MYSSKAGNLVLSYLNRSLALHMVVFVDHPHSGIDSPAHQTVTGPSHGYARRQNVPCYKFPPRLKWSLALDNSSCTRRPPALWYRFRCASNGHWPFTWLLSSTTRTLVYIPLHIKVSLALHMVIFSDHPHSGIHSPAYQMVTGPSHCCFRRPPALWYRFPCTSNSHWPITWFSSVARCH